MGSSSTGQGNAEWVSIDSLIQELAREGRVTRTFRHLDPERQYAVVNAILAEAAARGPTEINIKEVARRAGVSVGSLYQYFGNRDGLLGFAVALSVGYTVGLFEQFGPELAALPLRDALHTYLMGGLEWGETEQGLVRFLCRAAYQGESELTASVVRPVADVMLNVVREMLRQAAERGEIDRDRDLEAAARVVNVMLIAVGDSQLLPYLNQYTRVSDDGVALDRVIDSMLSIIVDGLGRGPGPAGDSKVGDDGLPADSVTPQEKHHE